MSRYIHELERWPDLRWSNHAVIDALVAVGRRQGRLVGRMESLGSALCEEAALVSLTAEVVASSEIEGETLDRDQIRAEIARQSGMRSGATAASDGAIAGQVAIALDAAQRHAAPLTVERLLGWNAALSPLSGKNWRGVGYEPMQIVTTIDGRETVRYEAPPSHRIPAEMKRFLAWFERAPDADPILHAAIAHLWLIILQPFEDNSDRIARAVADMVLARCDGGPHRFYGMSTQICAESTAYYDVLDMALTGNLDITLWLEWFIGCLGRAIDGAERVLAGVLDKARFLDAAGIHGLNDRQKAMLGRLVEGIEGGLSSTLWATLTGTSQDTASRDINDLVGKGLLVRQAGGGRSTRYALQSLARSR